MKNIFCLVIILNILFCFGVKQAYAQPVNQKGGNFQYLIDSSKIKKHKKTGCCSNHGGIKECSAFGYYRCNDGHLSKTCRCGKN